MVLFIFICFLSLIYTRKALLLISFVAFQHQLRAKLLYNNLFKKALKTKSANMQNRKVLENY